MSNKTAKPIPPRYFPLHVTRCDSSAILWNVGYVEGNREIEHIDSGEPTYNRDAIVRRCVKLNAKQVRTQS